MPTPPLIPADLLAWLLDSDPSIRYQTLRDLTDTPAEELAQERARIATEGHGARLLALQGPDGQWAGGACFPGPAQRDKAIPGQPWTSTLPVLQLLQEFAIDPTTPTIQQAIAQVHRHCHWEHANQPFFSGEVEPCINGRTVTLGVYFGAPIGIDTTPIVHRLLSEQLQDGGWNCEAENGSTRSSFATTLNVLEGLLAYEQALTQNHLPPTPSPVHLSQLTAARQRGEEYLLTRHLFRRLSTGEVVKPAWLQLSFPVRWHYDILRALDYFRTSSQTAGNPPDPRLQEAIQILRNKRQPNTSSNTDPSYSAPAGHWLLENTHPGKAPFPLEAGDHHPSRWNTLRALRVLHWYDPKANKKRDPPKATEGSSSDHGSILPTRTIPKLRKRSSGTTMEGLPRHHGTVIRSEKRGYPERKRKDHPERKGRVILSELEGSS